MTTVMRATNASDNYNKLLTLNLPATWIKTKARMAVANMVPTLASKKMTGIFMDRTKSGCILYDLALMLIVQTKLLYVSKPAPPRLLLRTS